MRYFYFIRNVENKSFHFLIAIISLLCVSLKPPYVTTHLPKSENPIVLRTTFEDDSSWKKICDEIIKPEETYGFFATVEFISDSSFAQWDQAQILEDTASLYTHSFIFIVDSITVASLEHPILCIGLRRDKGKSFRVIPSEMWGVENNLSISNMDFDSFMWAADADGVFRGFK